MAAPPSPSSGRCDSLAAREVRISPKYVLRRIHVEDAFKGVPGHARNVTVWVHSSTLGIEENCFEEMKRVSRILVWGPEPHDVCAPLQVDAAVLGAFIAKLRAYEPALVDAIM
jgi:hypothetical protein